MISGPLKIAGCRKVNTGLCGTERRATAYLVHIVPDVYTSRALGPTPPAVLPSVELVQVLVPFPAVWIEEIDPSTASAPTPPFKLASMLVLDEQIKLLCFLVNGVILGAFDVWIDNDNHLGRRVSLPGSRIKPSLLTLRARASTSLNMSTGSGKYFLFQIMYL